jgi:hypothetical protein
LYQSQTLRKELQDDATPRFDDESNTNNNEEDSKMRTLTDAKLEDLMKRLEKFTAENNKLRKRLKPRGLKEPLPQVKKKTHHMKRMSPKKGRKKETITINLPLT